VAFQDIAIGAFPNDDTGDTLRNGGIKINNNFAKAVEGPASATTGNVAVYNSTSGKLLRNGTKSEDSLVQGPASSTTGNVAVFDSGSGKLLRNSTKTEANLVTGSSASVLDNALVSFDGTTGKVVKAPGNAVALSNVNSIDTLESNGFYAWATSRPVGAVAQDFVQMLHLQRATGSRSQLALKSSGAQQMYVRGYTLGAWQDWYEVYHQNTILGTVSQTGGLPTGAVIEYGTSANGQFVRYADGTQMCWVKGTFVSDVGAFSSATRLSGDWTYPAVFADAATTSASVNVPVHTSGNFIGCDRLNIVTFGPSGGTTTGIAISVFFTGGVSTTNAFINNMMLTAIGRWY
jgi:hypothetical protein